MQAFDQRVRITITSYRRRLADPDGISGKAAIDGCVEAGILRDDSAKWVESVSFRQIKVAADQDEKTEITFEAVTHG